MSFTYEVIYEVQYSAVGKPTLVTGLDRRCVCNKKCS